MPFFRTQHSGNAAKTTLTADITASSTSINIASTAGWPDGSVGPFVIVIDRGLSSEEKVLIASRSGNTLTVATNGRGFDGTAAASHNNGAFVEHCLSATEYDEFNQTTVQTLGAVQAKGDLLAGSGANALTRVPAGTNGSLLTADSAQAAGIKWISPSLLDHGSLGGLTDDDHPQYVRKDILTTKGDLYVASSTASPVRVAVGSNGQFIVADSSQTAGIKWIDPAGAGLSNSGGVLNVNVDNSTIEIVSDTLQLKSGAIPQALPAGAILPYAGIIAPAGFLWCNGVGASKTAYAALWNALHLDKGTCTISIGSPAVVTIAGTWAEGMIIYFTTTGSLPTGLMPNTNYYIRNPSGNTFNLSTTLSGALINTSGSQSGTHSLTHAPFGVVDANNFLLPDLRARVPIGQENMQSGNNSNRITSLISGIPISVLGGSGGNENLPQHSHTATASPHSHTVNDPGHFHSTGKAISGSGFVDFTGPATFNTTEVTGTSTTGITLGNTTVSVTVNTAGSGTSGNIPPGLVLGYIIKT